MKMTQDMNLTKRIQLIKELLELFTQTEESIATSENRLVKISEKLHTQSLDESSNEIVNEADQYTKNIEEANSQNVRVTSEINDWYGFVKDRKSAGSLFFPIKFYFFKRRLKKSIKNANDKIQNISISNRFVKERLVILGQKLEINTTLALKSSQEYLEYEKLLEKKESILSELQYLLPSIPDVCPVDLGDNGAYDLLGKLSEFKAN